MIEFKEYAHTLQKGFRIRSDWHVKRSRESTDMYRLRSSTRELLTQDEPMDYDCPWRVLPGRWEFESWLCLMAQCQDSLSFTALCYEVEITLPVQIKHLCP